MPEQRDIDLRTLASYQRRLVVTAMKVVGRMLLAVSVVMMLLGIFGVFWGDGSVRLLLIVLSSGGVALGVALVLAGDDLPRVPGTQTARQNMPAADDLGDAAGA